MSFSRGLLGGLAVLLSFGACSGLEEEAPEGEVPQFEVSKVIATKMEPKAVQSEFGLVIEKIYTLQTCVKDSALLEPVAGASFEVSEGASPQTAETDVNGCFHWQERLMHHELADEIAVEMRRTLRGSSDYSGSVPLWFAINPWLGPSEGVVDLKYEKIEQRISEAEARTSLLNPGSGGAVPPITAGVSSGSGGTVSAPQRENLRLKNGAWVEVSDYQGSEVFRLMVFLPIETVHRALDGTEKTRILEEGTFDVELNLVERADGRTFRLGTARQVMRLQAGKAVGPLTIVVERGLAESSDFSQLDFVVKAVPQSPGLSTVTAISSLQAESLERAARFPLSAVSSVRYSQRATGSISELEGAKRKSGEAKDGAFQIDLADTKHSERIFPRVDDEGLPRPSILNYWTWVTLRSHAGKAFKPGVAVNWNVRSESGSVVSSGQNKDTDSHGRVLIGEEELEFDPYGARGPIPRVLEVECLEGPYAGSLASVPLNLYPWGEGRRIFLGNQGLPPEEAQSADLSLRDLSYVQGHPGHARTTAATSVNPSLELTEERYYTVYVQPRVTRNGQSRESQAISRDELEQVRLGYRLMLVFPIQDQSLDLLKQPMIGRTAAQNASSYGNGECFVVVGVGYVCPFKGSAQIEDGKLEIPLRVIYGMNERAYLQSRGRLFVELYSPHLGLNPASRWIHFYAVAGKSEVKKTASNADIESEHFVRPVVDAIDPGNYYYQKDQSRMVSHPQWALHDLAPPAWRRSQLRRVGFEADWQNNQFIDGWFEHYERAISKAAPEMRSNEGRLAAEWEPPIDDVWLKDESRQFCQAFYPYERARKHRDRSVFERCQEDPARFMAFIPMKHVEEVLDIQNEERAPGEIEVRIKSISTADLNVEESFFAESGEVLANVAENKFIAKLGGEVPGFEIAGIGWEGAVAVQLENHMRYRERERLAHRRSMRREQVALNFDARIRRCVWIVPRPFRIPTEAGLHLCQTKTSRQLVTERWNYIGWSLAKAGEQLNDPWDPDHRGNHFHIRGVTSYGVFLDRVQENATYVIAKLNEAALNYGFGWQTLKQYLYRTSALELGGLGRLLTQQMDVKWMGLGETVMLDPIARPTFGSDVLSSLFEYTFDNNISGLVDEPDQWHGLKLMNYFADRDRSVTLETLSDSAAYY